MAKKRDNAKSQKVREELWKTFFHEIDELLENLEHQLLSLENDKSNVDLIAALFRTMHTIKGTCGMMGLGNVESLAHKAEDMMDLVRDEKLSLTDDMMDLMFEALDTFKASKALILEFKSDEGLPISPELVSRLQGYIQQAGAGGSCIGAAAASLSTTNSSESIHEATGDGDLWEQLTQECVEQLDNSETLCLHLESFPDDAATIDSLFRVLHSLKGSFNLAGLSQMTQLLHLAEDLVGITRDGTTAADPTITDALLAVIDQVRSHLNAHKSQRTDLSAQATTKNIETLKSLILSIDPERTEERLSAEPEPQMAEGDGQLEIDAEYLEIFFEIVWPSLNAMKAALKAADKTPDEKTFAALKEAVEEIVHAAEQMQLNEALHVVREFLALVEAETPPEQLIDPLNGLWHFFWDLEDKLPQMLSALSDKSQASKHTAPQKNATSQAAQQQTSNTKPPAPIAEPEKQSADDFFDHLWPQLAQLRKSIEHVSADQDRHAAQEQVKNIQKITGPAQELDLSQWLKTLTELLTQTDAADHTDALAKAVQEIYTLCWDMEDQLQGTTITLIHDVTTPEAPAAQDTQDRPTHPSTDGTDTARPLETQYPGERKAPTANNMRDSRSPEPAPPGQLPGIEHDPLMLSQDPLFAIDFLEKAQEDMGEYQKLKLSWERNEANFAKKITHHLNQFAEAAQRLGYQALQRTIAEFIQAQTSAQWEFDAKASKRFELNIFGLLTKIEEGLPESVSNRHHSELNISHIFKQWHANQFFHTLEDCNVALNELKRLCLRWQQGQMNESELNQTLKQAHDHIESIIFTCQYHALTDAEDILLHISDTLMRTEYDKSNFTVDQIEAIAVLIRNIGGAVHAVTETGSNEGEEIAAAYQHFKSLVGHETNDSHVQTAKKFFESLTLPDCVLEVLDEHVMSTVGQKLAETENLFLLFIDIEHDETLAEQTFELLESDAFETIINATDYVDNRSVFHFLIHSHAAEAHLIQLLRKIDSSGEYLRVQRLAPKAEPQPMQNLQGFNSDSTNLTAGASQEMPDLSANLDSLQATVGELISVKANLGQISQSMANLDLFEFIDKAISKQGGDWGQARESVRQYLNHYDTDLKDLVKAQEDVVHVLDKLQQDMNNIREIPVDNLMADAAQWFKQTPVQQQNEPNIKANSSELRIERALLEQLKLPLRQLLFLFKRFGQTASNALLVLSAHAGNQHHTIELRCQHTGIARSLLTAWGLPEDQPIGQWLKSVEQLPPAEENAQETPTVALQQLQETLSSNGATLEFYCQHDSWQGFTIYVPTDNQVIDGITVISQNTYYIFPVQLVKRIINLEDAKRIDASASPHNALIQVGHSVLPLIHLKTGPTQTTQERQVVLILSQEAEERAIVVDELVGLQQVLVSPLEGQLAGASKYQGCAVLGKDRIGMVISPNAIF